mmetsp:Transcript_37233/g.37714  ORF Transcript_37233/g.37714 Transcript_37233/m.37714 type:complete len:142 (+) Transcript_37233:278-703(+)
MTDSSIKIKISDGVTQNLAPGVTRILVTSFASISAACFTNIATIMVVGSMDPALHKLNSAVYLFSAWMYSIVSVELKYAVAFATPNSRKESFDFPPIDEIQDETTKMITSCEDGIVSLAIPINLFSQFFLVLPYILYSHLY